MPKNFYGLLCRHITGGHVEKESEIVAVISKLLERRLEYEIDFIIIIRLLFLNCYQISQATQLEGIKCKNSHLLSDTYFIDRNREKKSERYTAVVSR